ncbi:MAG: glycerophosphodiester phosphodiesterase family protein [Phycisphaerales bacterium]
MLMRTLGVVLALSVPAFGGQTVWDFPAGSPLTATAGSGVLSYRGTTGGLVQSGTASSFGLPLPAGGDTGVLLVPTLSASQGIGLDTASGPNGVHVPNGWTSNYTIVMDILIPSSSFASWRSLFNTNLTNANDGDFFIDPSGRVGISGLYNGTLLPDRWHRLSIVVGAADNEGLAQKYIDGVFVGGHGGTGYPISSRWALFSMPGIDVLLFGDNNNETAPIYVSSLMFADRRLSPDEVASLGGPTAGGVLTAGAAGVGPSGYTRCADAIAHRGDSGAAPENTLAALAQAVAKGASAIEMDIGLAADGVVVLMHDSTLDRTTDLSGAVSSFTSAQLATADAGSWFDPSFAGEHVPTLVEALQLLDGTGVTPYLDVKVSSIAMAQGIQNAMVQAGYDQSEVLMWAFSRGQMSNFNAVFSSPRIVCGETPQTPAQFAEVRNLNVVGFDLGFENANLNPSWISLAQSEGFFVSTYTIVDPVTMQARIEAGVDFIETDYPAMVVGAGRAPAMGAAPGAVTKCAGATAVFAGSANEADRFRWTYNNTALIDGVHPLGFSVSGASTTTLTLTGLTPGASGAVRFFAGNACAETGAVVAGLTVLPDLNSDGFINTGDLVEFLGQFGTLVQAGRGGDLNADGAVNTADLTAFLGAFGTACP